MHTFTKFFIFRIFNTRKFNIFSQKFLLITCLFQLLNKSFRSENSENIFNTPLTSDNILLKSTGTVTPVQDLKNGGSTPLQSKSINLSKRLNSSSLNKNDGLLKKKKLEFFESICTDSIPHKNTSNFSMHNKTVVPDTPLPLTQNIETLLDDDILHSPEFIAEMKHIEFLKQKNLHRRLQSGLKMTPGLLKTNFKSPQELFGDDFLPASQLSAEFGFKSASTIMQAIDYSRNSASCGRKESANSSETSPSHAEKIRELDELIAIWRRGLRDAIEYLSCLSYPPTDISEIIRHFNISSEWLTDK